MRHTLHAAWPKGPMLFPRSPVEHKWRIVVGILALAGPISSACGQGCFEPYEVLPSGNGASFIVSADVNSDGWDDLLVGKAFTNDVSMFINQRNGTFSAPSTLSFISSPKELKAADVDGDGDLDLVVPTSLDVMILRNSGGGTFSAPVAQGQLIGANSVACADLDGDGDLDLVVALGGGSAVDVLLNDGTGSFSFLSIYHLTASFTLQVQCADLNADGKPDIVTTNNGQNTLSVLLNQGNAVFAPPIQYPVGVNPARVVIADLNGNGSLDLASVNVIANNVSVLLNVGNGTFAPHVDYPAGSTVGGVVAVDWDADGDLDLVVPNAINSTVLAVLSNQGNGTFALPVFLEMGAPCSGASAFDLDHDGDLDLAMGSLHDVLIARNCATIGSLICNGNGSGPACPCGNDAVPGSQGGCLNSLGVASELIATGLPTLSSDSVQLDATSLPNAPALFFQGVGIMSGIPFGDGLRCVTGSIIRLGQRSAANNEARFPASGQPALSAQGAIPSPGVRYYQVWYRNAASFCTPSTFNWTNALGLNWLP